MDDKQLQKIQNEIMQEMDKEAKIEKDIIEASESIASQLMFSNKIKAKVNEKEYLFAFKELPMPNNEKLLFMVISDVTRYNVTNGKYLPFTAKAIMDKRYSLKDNLKTIVEAFIRHVTGRIKPEVLEE